MNEELRRAIRVIVAICHKYDVGDAVYEPYYEGEDVELRRLDADVFERAVETLRRYSNEETYDEKFGRMKQSFITMRFDEAERRAQAIRNDLRNKVITDDEAHLLRFVHTSILHNGSWYAIGVESGKWYRHVQDNWIESPRPDDVVIVEEEATDGNRED